MKNNDDMVVSIIAQEPGQKLTMKPGALPYGLKLAQLKRLCKEGRLVGSTIKASTWGNIWKGKGHSLSWEFVDGKRFVVELSPSEKIAYQRLRGVATIS